MDAAATDRPAPAIRTTGLTKRYRDNLAVAGLDLVVPAGHIVGFLGPNGAGKSTTIAMLLGLARPTAGQIEMLGIDASRDRRPLAHCIGAMLETPSFYPYLTAHDNLLVQVRLLRLAPALIPGLLDHVGLAARSRQPVRTFSLGQRQRLGLAAALLGHPRLLILDEPTNGLDPAGLRTIHDVLRAFVASGGTIFFSSHRLAEVQDLCTHVAVLRAGHLVAQGPVADLLDANQAGGLIMRVSEPDRARDLLAAAAWPVRLATDAAGPVVRVHAPAGRAAEVNALLTSHGIGVTELRADQRGLDDLFRTLTEAAHG
jgi:ABC-2 type transport system ATP-binding protein